MCGIAGELDWIRGSRTETAVARMIERLAHRGPEGHSCWTSGDGKVALAHARLTFFKAAQPQPVTNRRGTIAVVCNGEIYNHGALAQMLRSSGTACEPRSDVEVIPFLFERYGIHCFAMLRGEFALALYDSEERTLFLVRDRFGIKPLCYHAAGGFLAFASEAKALFANPRVPRVLDADSLGTKILGVTLPGRTSFARIRDVRPAHYLRVTEAGTTERPYWSLALKPSAAGRSTAELSGQFLQLFDEAVRLRLHGDYPIGAYLSGGIDSSATVASMARDGAHAVKAFTIAFDDRSLDESRIAATTAARLGVEHHVLRVSDRDIADNFLRSIWHSEIPVLNGHGTAKFLLSRAARSHVKAIMTGEGADELFAGYPYFGVQSGTGAFDGLRRPLVSWLRLGWTRQFGTRVLSAEGVGDIQRLNRLIGAAPHLAQRALFYARFVRPLLSPDYKPHCQAMRAVDSLAAAIRSAPGGAMTATDIDRYLAIDCDLPAYILNFLGDRQEMAHSIEGRVPFLDDEVVAFAATLREEDLVGRSAGKAIIRQAFAQRLPAEVLTSRKKIFFAPSRACDEILRSEWGRTLLSKSMTESVGIFHWPRLMALNAVLAVSPAKWGVGSALRSLLVMVVSVHALHRLFLADGA